MGRQKSLSLLNRTTELTRLLKKSSNITVFLTELASMIAKHMDADSCSFFIYDRDLDELVLRGTVGLPEEYIGKLRLKPGEGITGTVLKTLRPIRAGHANTHPDFKPYPGIGEEQFQSLVAVPIRRGMHKIGVISLHKKESEFFSLRDVTILMAIASQIASSVLSAGFFLSLKSKAAPVSIKSTVSGQGASTGIAIGKSMMYNRQQFFYADEVDSLASAGQTFSVKKFERAIDRTLSQLKEIEDHLGDGLSDIAGLIFTAHYLMIKDPNYTGTMRSMIEEGMSAEKAIRSVTDEYARLIAASENPRIQEKEQDVRDLEHRLLSNLQERASEQNDYSEYVIIASTLYPSELVRFWVQKAKAVVLFGQGLTAHIAILARSLSVPLLLVNDRDVLKIPNGTRLIIDAAQGLLHVSPDAKKLKSYKELSQKHPPIPHDLPLEDRTLDGHLLSVHVNVNILHDAEAGFSRNAGGIGLYRSEFPFLMQNDFPSEEQQVQVYKHICRIAGDREITLRTLDIGGDKLPGFIDDYSEENPFLGFRGIRYSLEATDIFMEQIRAMLRAGYEKRLRILFPMISSLEEFISAKHVVHTCMEQLEREGIDYCRKPKLGAMIEIPAAVEIAGDLAEEADFLSIGTNDLIMYLIAVDRANERVGDMHTAYHPAVIRTLGRLVRIVKEVRDPGNGFLSVCGDAAGDVTLLPFLIGIGICCFSVEPARLVSVKQHIAEVSYESCVNYAQQLLAARTVTDIDSVIKEHCPGRICGS